MTNLNPLFALLSGWFPRRNSYRLVSSSSKYSGLRFIDGRIQLLCTEYKGWMQYPCIQNSMHHCGAHRLAYHRHLRIAELVRQNWPDVVFFPPPRSLSTLPAATSFHITTFFHTQCLTGCWNLSQLSLVKAGLHPGWVAILLSRTERQSHHRRI